MKIEVMKVKDLVLNTDNPRSIAPDKLEKLKKSIKEFPEMLKLRPVVIDENNVVLGGNMRLTAHIESGLDDIPVIRADDLTEEQKKEFVIKDNVSGGEWDWDMLQADWDTDQLDAWGLDVEPFDDNESKEIKEEDLSSFKNAHILISINPQDFQTVIEHVYNLDINMEVKTSAN